MGVGVEMPAKKTSKPTTPRYGVVFRDNDERAALAKRIWKETIEALTEVDALSAANLARADRYARARVEYEVFYPGAAEEGPILKGPNGGDVFNGRWAAVEKLGDRLLKLEKAMFGEAVIRPLGEKPKGEGAPSDEFLRPDYALRQ